MQDFEVTAQIWQILLVWSWVQFGSLPLVNQLMQRPSVWSFSIAWILLFNLCFDMRHTKALCPWIVSVHCTPWKSNRSILLLRISMWSLPVIPLPINPVQNGNIAQKSSILQRSPILVPFVSSRYGTDFVAFPLTKTRTGPWSTDPFKATLGTLLLWR